MDLSPEQIKSQEIEALTWMPWWGYLVEDFKKTIDEYEDFIHDVNVPDVLEYSKKSIYISYVNTLKAVIEKPQSLLWELKSVK